MSLKMGPQPLKAEECKAEQPQVEVVMSTASLKEGSTTVTCSKASIKSKASRTSVKSSEIPLKNDSDASPKVYTTVVKV